MAPPEVCLRQIPARCCLIESEVMSQNVSKIEAELSELRQAHSLARAQGEFSEAHRLAQQILDGERELHQLRRKAA